MRAVRTAMQAGTIQYGDRVHTLWTPVTKSRCLEVMRSVQACVDATVARVNVDVNPRDLQTAFACFDLEAWWNAKQSLQLHDDPEPWQHCHKTLMAAFRLLCKAMRLERTKCQVEAEFEAVLAELLEPSTLAEVQKEQDSRILGYGRPLNACGGEFSTLPVLVSWYCSILDGECQVERDLSMLKAILTEHKGSMDIDGVTVAELLELRLDGPQCQEDIAKQITGQDVDLGDANVRSGGVLQMSDFTRECQALYIEKYGRRFRCYKERADKGQARKKRENTVVSFMRKQRRAVSNLVRSYGEDSASMQATCLAIDRKHFVQRQATKMASNPQWDNALAKFHRVTLQRQTANQKARAQLQMGLPADRPELRRGDLLKADRRLRHDTDVPVLSPEAKVLDVTFAGMEDPPLRGQTTRPAQPDTVSFQEMLKATIVVVDDVLAVEQMRSGRLGLFTWMKLFIYESPRTMR